MKRLIIGSFLLMLSTGQVAAQGFAIDVRQFNDDIVGKQFTYDLREQIAKSAQYHLSSDTLDIVLLVQSIDPFANLPGQELTGRATVVNITILIISPDNEGVFLSSQMFTVGRNKTADVAKMAMAHLDSQLRKPVPVFKP